MPVDEVRKLINAIDDHRTEFSSPPFISKKLRGLIKVPEPIAINEKKSIENKNEQTMDKLKQIEDELQYKNEQTMDKLKDELKKQLKDELKQTKNELMKDMQELLNSFVKNSNSNNNVKDKINE